MSAAKAFQFELGGLVRSVRSAPAGDRTPASPSMTTATISPCGVGDRRRRSHPFEREGVFVARNNASMKDVATLAGVSVGTVSNALNHPELVSEPARKRVQEAIEKLGWVRNESARQLRAGRSSSIGLVVMDIANPFFSDLTRGVEDVAAANGYSVILLNSAQLQEREDAHLELLKQLRVQGLVLAPISELPSRSGVFRNDVPVVLADRAMNARDHCTVSVDDFTGGSLAAQHLLEQGHRRLAVVGGRGVIPQVRERRDGAGRAVLLHREATMQVISTDMLDVAAGRAVADTIAAMPVDERPTGIFAVNDLVSIGLLQGMVTSGIRVPEEVAIIGYDDIGFAAAAAVPLSSVRQPRADLGRRATELLLAEIDSIDSGEPHVHEQAVFTPELVVRASSGRPWPAPARHGV
jgi:LacI family transcriptional regulator